MKLLLWVLRNLFRGLSGIQKMMEEGVRCQKRALELQEMALMLQYGAKGGKSGGLLTMGTSTPGDESVHWTSESEEVRREQWKKAYEAQFGVKLGPYELPPQAWQDEMRKMEGEGAPL